MQSWPGSLLHWWQWRLKPWSRNADANSHEVRRIAEKSFQQITTIYDINRLHARSDPKKTKSTVDAIVMGDCNGDGIPSHHQVLYVFVEGRYLQRRQSPPTAKAD